MRILGIMALCLVLIAGLIFVYDRRNEVVDRIADRFEGVLLDDVSTVDATPDQIPLSDPAEGLMIIPMGEAGTLNTLIGLPSFARATFDMPVASTVRSGEIVLEIAGTLQDDAAGLLRVTVNGARKTVQVVDSGTVHRKLTIALNTRDLSSNRLTVALALEGRTPEAECSVDWDGGAALQILPGSHLRLTMTGPVENPVDLLRMAGKRPVISWPIDGSDQQGRRFVQAYNLAQRTDDVTFAIDGRTTVDLSADILDDVIAATAMATEATEATVSDTIDPADLAAALGVQRTREFEGETRWRVTFARGDFAEAIAAVQLDLALASITTADQPWLMVAKLNDRLLTSTSIAVESSAVSQTIPLPQDVQLDQNVLTISLRNSAETQDRCATGVPAVAELTTLSIVADGPKTQTPIATLAQAIDGPLAVAIAGEIGPLEAQVALDTIRGLSDQTQRFGLVAQPRAGAAGVAVVSRDSVRDAVSSLDTGRHWLVFQDVQADSLRVLPIGPSTQIEPQTMPRAVLIVSPANGS